MKYKFKYEDSIGQKHIRYYNALNVNTAREMFKASVEHSFGDKNITILEIYKLDCETGDWRTGSVHISDERYISSLK